MAEQMQFIDLSANSSRASEQNRFLIRSHIAKNNRRKRTLRSVHGSERVGLQRQPIVASKPKQEDDSQANEGNLVVDGSQSLRQSPEEHLHVATSNAPRSASPPLLDLAPPAEACGALSAVSSGAADLTSFGESARFLLQVMMPNAFVPPLAWFEKFCQEPLVFNAVASLLNFQLLFTGSRTPATRSRMLIHKGEAIRLLNHKITHLADDDIETVLIGMLTVYPEEEEIRRASSFAPSLFVSHMPWANNATMNAGVDPEGLQRAIAALVARAGGLQNLKLPEFPKTMAKADLLIGSSSYVQPLLPWLWPVYLHPAPGDGTTMDSRTSTMTAFDVLPGLPDNARCRFNDLKLVDQAMANIRTHGQQAIDLDLDLDYIVTARDTAHHRLLLLPRWRDTVEPEQDGTDEFVYECCRLTSILYVHCVVTPLLPGCPGISRPLAELRAELELNTTRFQDPRIVAMALWSLLVGSITAFGTQQRPPFIQMLRQLVIDRHITSFQHALDMCRAFIWADCACLQGASVIWDMMGFIPNMVTPD